MAAADAPRPPVRPGFPLALLFAVGTVLGASLALDGAWNSYVAGGCSPTPFAAATPAPSAAEVEWAVLLSSTVTAAVLVVYRRGRLRRSRTFRLLVLGLAAVAAGIACGSLVGAHAGASWCDKVAAICARYSTGLTAQMATAETPTQYGGRGYATVELSRGGCARLAVYTATGTEGRAAEPDTQDPARLVAGDRVLLADVRPLRQSERYLFDAGAVAVGSVRERTGRAHSLLADYRQHAARLIGSDPTPGTALLFGLLLGDRGLAGQTGLDVAYRAAGVSHVLAVSGTHLAVVVGMVLLVGRKAGAARWLLLAGALVAALTFVLATGSQLSALRALGMLAVSTWALLSTRRPDPLAALGTVVSVMVLSDPFRALSVGLLLSASAVVGIVLLYRLVNYHLRWLFRVVPESVSSSAAVAIVAQLSTTPMSVLTFGTVPVYGLPANLLIVPISSAALVVGQISVLLGSAAHGAGALCMSGARWLAEVSATIATAIAAVPGAEVAVQPQSAKSISLAVLSLLTMLYVWWPVHAPRSGMGSRSPRVPRLFATQLASRFRRLAAALAGACAVIALVVGTLVSASTASQSTVEFLDVGQGDAVLIRSGGATALIDAGPDPGLLEGHLTLRRIQDVDLLILTHDHADHARGAPAAIRRMRSGTVWVARGAGGSPVYGAVLQPRAEGEGPVLREVGAGDSARIGDLTVEVLSPSEPVGDPSANDSCLILRVVRTEPSPRESSHPLQPDRAPPHGGIIIGGDAEATATLRAAQLRGVRSISVLKVGHHGSADSISEALLAVMQPRVAVISVGAGNEYGHPHGTVLDLLLQMGIQTLRTDADGSITVRL